MVKSSDPIDRRAFLASASTTTATLLCTGCVPAVHADVPDLVWGRRGMSDGRFLKPRAIAIDSADRLYICDTTGRIQVFDADGEFQRVWSTPDTANGRPTGLQVRAADALVDRELLLVADTHYYRMLVYELDGTLVESAGIGGTAGFGPGEFAFVTEAVCDADGCTYIGEYGDSDRIQKFDPDGTFVCQWGSTGREAGQFVRPQSMVVDGEVLVVLDACNHRIQRFDLTQSTPALMDIWGSNGSGPGQFKYPYDIAVFDRSDRREFLICEYSNQRVQRLDQSGQSVGMWGGPGHEIGQLNQPWGVVADSKGRVHVLDSNNHRVQRIADWV